MFYVIISFLLSSEKKYDTIYNLVVATPKRRD